MENFDFPYIHRDISWLSFNHRVLQEAMDPNVPLLERIKFLAIYSSNLDEFFRVRVGQLRSLAKMGKKAKKELEFDPKNVLKKVIKTVNKQAEIFSRIFSEEIVPQLAKYHIHLLRMEDINDEQKRFVEDYFQDQMLPFVQPVLLVKNRVKPFLNNAALYLTLLMVEKGGDEKNPAYAIAKIPSDHLPRFLELPPSESGRRELIILDDVVRHNAQYLFPGYEIRASYSIKLSRDAELYIEDEFSGDLIQKIKESLSKRVVGTASRLVYDRKMPEELLHFLMETFELEKQDLLPEGRYHNNFDFFQFPDFGLGHLKNNPLPSLPYPVLEEAPDLFEALKGGEYLLHFPYHSYESVVRLFEVAAADLHVTHIKIVQYRVARRSRIMEALMKAAAAGKRVSVFVEVKARFDEEANLRWAEKLEKAGVQVHYSFPGVKVHAKIGLIIREEQGHVQFYSYLSTGNFHEETVKVYSDFGFFTTKPYLTNEVARVFSYLETVQRQEEPFEFMLVGQYNLRETLEALIDNEISNAKAGKPASIILKLNSLQDPKMIQKLYAASQAGVTVKLIIRGICSLVTEERGWSENIQVISIVDRFLEHARVFLFHNDGDEKIYLASADWMVRNLSHRVETAFPLLNPDHRNEMKELLYIQFKDNVKARNINHSQTNPYLRKSSALNIRAQVETYYYLKRKLEEAKLENQNESAV
ncbi:MAG: polyphosphate kinase 1 [Saprospiraceae bacterium]|jgi:polyphosphate kinase